MVIGGYALDLYCDCQTCAAITTLTEYRSEETGFRQFTGQTNGECTRAAKQSGWKFFRGRTECYAPGHEWRVSDDRAR